MSRLRTACLQGASDRATGENHEEGAERTRPHQTNDAKRGGEQSVRKQQLGAESMSISHATAWPMHKHRMMICSKTEICLADVGIGEQLLAASGQDDAASFEHVAAV